MNTSTVTFSVEEWHEFRSQYGELKHSINNALAVFLALAELAKRNPANYEKLAAAIELRTPEIVATFQHFTEAIEAKKPV